MMRRAWLALPLLLGGVLLAPAGPAAAHAARWQIPIEVKKFPNGLTVVVSQDHSAPTFGLCLAFRIGFRLEPKGRTGFAHLFEHMMFEGTPNAPKGVFDRVIEGGGGVNNGSTRYDYTNYIETAPVSALDPILWLEADRMKTLDFSEKNLKNQQEVVKEEIRVNVKNRPYGIFFWTDVAGKAFDKWENSHDGYGSFEDLDAAKLADVEAFFKSYYGPNNAILAIVGDVKPAEVFGKVEKYFGGIPARQTPQPPDVSEAMNQGERTLEQTDPLARVPGIAVAWKMPARGSRDHVPAAVLADLLVGGEASRFYQVLVKGKEILLSVQGGLNWPLGTPWDYNGPTLLDIFAIYKPTTDARTVVDAMNGEIEKVAREGVPAGELARTKTKMAADLYSTLELPLNRSTALCLAQLFTGNAASINELPGRIETVTSADLQRVAATYLTAANRTVVDRKPAPQTAAADPAADPR
ncbi:MAG TPA: pitrilysin family protein [Candidatus Polarisedimenticolia bacterium]|jgi:predicted Zn-dependent peptidase|nr:pitrilysin family protein [Candidatus Polarisedimenticolia bacterium]